MQMLKTTQGEQKEKNEILRKIQAEIDEQVGYGFFISREQREQTEAEIRSKYQAQLSALDSKYKIQRMGNLVKDGLKGLYQKSSQMQEIGDAEEEKTAE